MADTVLEWIVAVRDIPGHGLRIERKATDEERSRLAPALDIIAVDRLEITARITHRGEEQLMLSGKIDADVVQACVVSLDPVASRVTADMQIVLGPGGGPHDDREIEASESLLDEPDTDIIVNGEIDLGRIVYEELATALDPFPRLGDVSLEQSSAGSSSEDTSPFAKLAKLRKAPGTP